jgi:hypothetical protein
MHQSGSDSNACKKPSKKIERGEQFCSQQIFSITLSLTSYRGEERRGEERRGEGNKVNAW